MQGIICWDRLGLTPEQIVDRIEHLNLPQVFAALAYYHANQVLFEAEIAADDAATDLGAMGETDRPTP